MNIEKQRLRTEYLARRQGLSVSLQEQFSRQICDNIFTFITTAWPLDASPRVVAVYASMRGEVNLLDLAMRLRSHGIQTVYPKCFAHRQMSFYSVMDEGAFEKSRFGVPEPVPSDGSLANPGDIDLLCIPTLAFTREGLRLGYGGGFYDTYLSQSAIRGVRMGVGYSLQYIPALPKEPFDCTLDFIATEQGIHPCT